MKLTLGTPSVRSARADALVVTVFEGSRSVAGPLDAATASALSKLMAAGGGFSGKLGKVLTMPSPARFGARTVAFVGLGRKGRDLAEMTRRAAGTAQGKSGTFGAKSLVFLPPAEDAATVAAACEGFLLADYTFGRHQTTPASGAQAKKPAEKAVTVACPASAKAELTRQLPALRSLASAVALARDLGNEPANILTPVRMAEEAVALAKSRAKDGITCQVLGLKEIEKLGMGAYLAVARGSAHEPRFIHLTYRPKKRTGQRVALIGKGLTFDSGGISIKPAAAMDEMKHDMCGAAAVIGLFRCLPDLGIGHEVHGFVAACENMPSGTAFRPGDIVRSMAGRTIEVLNTDAEGRLTLVDAITYALRAEPDVMVDLATLTGACVVALGEASGIMSNDAALRDALWKSSDATGERAWPLPLFEDYMTQVKSEIADTKNLGERGGGALTAGLFLQAWVPDSVPWAHMDIAGSAWGKEQPYCPKGATGIGVRTLAHWLRGLGAKGA